MGILPDSSRFDFISKFLSSNPEDIAYSHEDQNKRILSEDGFLIGNFQPENLDEDEETIIQRLFIRGGRVSSYSEVLTNIDLDLSDVAEAVDKAGEDLELLKKDLEKDNVWLKEATEKYLEVKSFLSGLCINEEDTGKKKRFAFTLGLAIFSLISAVLFTGAVAGGTTLGTLEAVGYFGSTKIDKQELSISEEEVDLEARVQEIFLDNDLTLQNETREIAKKMEIFLKTRNAENKCREVENTLSVLNKGLWIMLNPAEYTYGYAPVLKKAIQVNGESSKFIDARKYGLDDETSLLRLSTSTAFVLKQEKEQKCKTTQLRTSFRSVNPSLQNIGLPTDNPYKFKVAEARFMWINPESFLPKTRFRPENSFSFQRTILTDDNIQVYPYNNTLLFLKSEGRIQVTFACPNGNTTKLLFPHPILRVKLDCQVVSSSLNVSSYKIDTFQGSIDSLVPDTLLNHPDSYVLYHDEEEVEIDEDGVRKLIKKLNGDGHLRNHLEREKLAEKSSLLAKAGERVMEIFSDAVTTIIIGGGAAITLVVVLLLLCCFSKCCK